jgi:hypothetical protein
LHLTWICSVKLQVVGVHTVVNLYVDVIVSCSISTRSCPLLITYYIVAFPVLEVSVYTLCTKSPEMFQTVEMFVRVLILCAVCIVLWWFVWLGDCHCLFCMLQVLLLWRSVWNCPIQISIATTLAAYKINSTRSRHIT